MQLQSICYQMLNVFFPLIPDFLILHFFTHGRNRITTKGKFSIIVIFSYEIRFCQKQYHLKIYFCSRGKLSQPWHFSFCRFNKNLWYEITPWEKKARPYLKWQIIRKTSCVVWRKRLYSMELCLTSKMFDVAGEKERNRDAVRVGSRRTSGDLAKPKPLATESLSMFPAPPVPPPSSLAVAFGAAQIKMLDSGDLWHWKDPSIHLEKTRRVECSQDFQSARCGGPGHTKS